MHPPMRPAPLIQARSGAGWPGSGQPKPRFGAVLGRASVLDHQREWVVTRLTSLPNWRGVSPVNGVIHSPWEAMMPAPESAAEHAFTPGMALNAVVGTVALASIALWRQRTGSSGPHVQGRPSNASLTVIASPGHWLAKAARSSATGPG